MANSYAVVPNILPGNVTIGGNLTVGGDVLRLGAAAPFVRLAKVAGTRALWSYNLGTDLVTRDSAGVRAMALFFEEAILGLNVREVGTAGAQTTGRPPRSVVVVGGTANITGTVAEVNFWSRTIGGTSLDLVGVLHARTLLLGNVQGAVASTFRYRFGGVVLDSFTKAALATVLWDLVVINKGATGAQEWFAVRTDTVAGVTLARGTAAVDTTANQDLLCSIQPGAATDSWDARCVVGSGAGGAGTLT